MNDAQHLTIALGGTWRGHYGTAPCPVCQPDRRKGQDALTLRLGGGGRLLAHCKRTACDFRAIMAAAGVLPGSFTPPDPKAMAQREAQARAEAAKRQRQARAIWSECLPIGGTIAETYLKARGVTCALPATLRFHPECWHGPTAHRHPAMVAAVEGADSFAVHRTYLRPDGAGKAGLDGGNKLMLGATTGGAVRLSGGASRLVAAEGIESALSLLCGLLDEPATIWAALSTSGLRGLRLPPIPAHLTIAMDGDTPGREAAHALATRAHALGWKVGLLDPGDGQDFNDHLIRKATKP